VSETVTHVNILVISIVKNIVPTWRRHTPSAKKIVMPTVGVWHLHLYSNLNYVFLYFSVKKFKFFFTGHAPWCQLSLNTKLIATSWAPGSHLWTRFSRLRATATGATPSPSVRRSRDSRVSTPQSMLYMTWLNRFRTQSWVSRFGTMLSALKVCPQALHLKSPLRDSFHYYDAIVIIEFGNFHVFLFGFVLCMIHKSATLGQLFSMKIDIFI